MNRPIYDLNSVVFNISCGKLVAGPFYQVVCERVAAYRDSVARSILTDMSEMVHHYSQWVEIPRYDDLPEREWKAAVGKLERARIIRRKRGHPNMARLCYERWRIYEEDDDEDQTEHRLELLDEWLEDACRIFGLGPGDVVYDRLYESTVIRREQMPGVGGHPDPIIAMATEDDLNIFLETGLIDEWPDEDNPLWYQWS